MRPLSRCPREGRAGPQSPPAPPSPPPGTKPVGALPRRVSPLLTQVLGPRQRQPLGAQHPPAAAAAAAPSQFPSVSKAPDAPSAQGPALLGRSPRLGTRPYAARVPRLKPPGQAQPQPPPRSYTPERGHGGLPPLARPVCTGYRLRARLGGREWSLWWMSVEECGDMAAWP